jgi:surface antigen
MNQHTVYVGGRAEQASGTACQQGDGTWRIVS